MGLDAYVRCRCWQDGLTSEPPFPRGLIVEDADGDLDLTVPYDGHEPVHHAFLTWRELRACPHEDMEIASVHVSSWGGYRIFQHALGEVGWDRLPTLRAHLPNANGGALPAAYAPRALAELRLLREMDVLGTQAKLVDGETGREVATYVPAYNGVFMWDGRVRRKVGVDPGGLFILGHDEREEFRATRCEQEWLGRDGGTQRVRLTSGTDTATVTLTTTIGGEPGEHPNVLAVRTSPVRAADFEYAITPLVTLCQAAIDSGNDVHWC